MGCGCKQTPLQRLEQRIRSWGWVQLTPPYLRIADEFIFGKMGVLPKDMNERIDLFNKSKDI
jgi:hypothetical protein